MTTGVVAGGWIVGLCTGAWWLLVGGTGHTWWTGNAN